MFETAPEISALLHTGASVRCLTYQPYGISNSSRAGNEATKPPTGFFSSVGFPLQRHLRTDQNAEKKNPPERGRAPAGLLEVRVNIRAGGRCINSALTVCSLWTELTSLLRPAAKFVARIRYLAGQHRRARTQHRGRQQFGIPAGRADALPLDLVPDPVALPLVPALEVPVPDVPEADDPDVLPVAPPEVDPLALVWLLFRTMLLLTSQH